MVYIGSDGHISQGSKPWGLSRLIDTLWAPLNFIAFFFQTLIPGGNNSGGATRYSIGGTSAGSSGSASRRPPGNGGSSRFRTISDVAPPMPSCRSCM
ncbi:selenoprotein K-like [Nilaparvata lugens]|uniref:selenoprotein K-like n=1 Tax=Nilaparvata lugens TaxID=108931 RepID=UPI00193DFF45|nr:selenoprotein K-like [Nilaparvata lugens]